MGYEKGMKVTAAIWGVLYLVIYAVWSCPVFPVKIVLGVLLCIGIIGSMIDVDAGTFGGKKFWQRLAATGLLLAIALFAGIPVKPGYTSKPTLPNTATEEGVLSSGVFRVLNSLGEPVSLDARKKPVLFISKVGDLKANEQVLKRVSIMEESKRPYIVGVYLDIDHLKSDMESINTEVKKYIPDQQVLYMLDPPPFPGTPAFFFINPEGKKIGADKVDTVLGLLDVWERILSKEVGNKN
ncbi:MAG: hypothetical protein ACPLSY_04850 [Moorellaceae bacterium]